MDDKVKCVLEELADSDISSTARLVAILAAVGITDPEEVERLTASRPSTVRRAKCALKNERSKSSDALENERCAQKRALENEQNAQNRAIERSKSSAAPRVRARNEYPSGIVIPKKEVEPPLSPSPQKSDARVAVENGRLVLCEDLERFWLVEFGQDRERLALALIQAAGYVQPHATTRPLEAQVSSQLARMAADRRDRDRRYAEAAKNSTSKTTASTVGSAAWKEACEKGRLMAEAKRAEQIERLSKAVGKGMMING